MNPRGSNTGSMVSRRPLSSDETTRPARLLFARQQDSGDADEEKCKRSAAKPLEKSRMLRPRSSMY